MDKFEEYIAYIGKVKKTKDELRKEFEMWLENPGLYNEGFFCVRWVEDEDYYNETLFGDFCRKVMESTTHRHL